MGAVTPKLRVAGGLVLGYLLFVGAGSPAETVAAENPVKDVLEIAKLVAEILALGVGGLWVWFNYFRGRVHRPRLEPRVVGSLVRAGGNAFIKLTVTVKNVGLSKVELRQEGTGLRVLCLDYAAPTGALEHLVTLPILEAHGWIEPGETVEESQIHRLPVADCAVQLELHLVGVKTMWQATTIVTADPQPKEEAHGTPDSHGAG
jgi:hypothetical protein